MITCACFSHALAEPTRRFLEKKCFEIDLMMSSID